MTACLAAVCCAAQSLAGMPVSAADASVPFADFASAVQKLTVRDADTSFYEKIDFHKNTGELYVDDLSAGKDFGELSVRNGSLCVKNPDVSGERSLTAAVSQSRWLNFEDAAEDLGYEYTVHGDTVTLTNEFQTARLIVKAKGRLDSHGAVSSAEGYRDLHIFQYADAAEAYQAYLLYKKDPRVQYVQPSHRVTLCQAELDGLEDNSYNTWGASAVGAEAFYTEWLKDKTLPEVKVAVIDTGINDAHSIFEGRILEGGINVSDSGNDSIADDLGHGTHCTGTICELTPENVKILPIKIFDKEGSAADEQIYLGMVYAMEQGAQIASMSFGGLGISPLEIEACELVNEQGMLCVAAAGNHADDAAYYYPGSIESCITVGAVDQNMQRASFSNFGELVDVVAPGVNIVSYTVGSAERTEKMSGTSMATPHVSACCALLKSYDPTLSPKRIEDLIKLNAKDLGEPGFDPDTAWGLVNLRDFRWDDGICRSPVFSEKSGNYGNFVTLELTTETEGASIYYSTDGTVPTTETGMLYTEPFTLTKTAQVIAVAVKDGFVTSAPAEGAFSVGGEDVQDALEIKDGVLVKYHGIRKMLTVPEAIGSERITAIGAEAFAENHYLTQVILPESVTVIGERAFANCPKLTHVTAYGADTIGAEAFAECALLESAEFANTMKTVGESAFSGCAALLSITLDGAADIPDGLCEGCTLLETVSVRDAKTFGFKAFYQCKAMRSLECDWEQVTAIGALAFSECSIWTGDLALYSLESLGTAVFSGDSSLVRVSLPETITELPGNTFLGCSGLRLLQLPGVTVLKDHALALRSTRADLITEMDYAKITDVEEGAFSGFQIGNGYDTVTFSSLKEIRNRAFTGVIGGALSFPQITAVPEFAFADCNVRVLYLEHAQSVSVNSLTGCTSGVFSSALKTVAAGAWADGFWVVTLDDIPALAEFENYQLCQEPLVLVNPDQQRSVQQHRTAVLNAFASGVGLKYQWYTVSGEELTEIAGADAAAYSADTSETGTVQYRCIMTDKGGKTETVNFRLQVTEAAAVLELTPEETVYPDSKADYVLTVPESGEWEITSYGAALMTGTLTDSRGRAVDRFHAEPDGTSVMRVKLEKGEQYLLSAEPMRDTVCSLLLSDHGGRTTIRNAAVTLEDLTEPAYGKDYQPSVTVMLNGKALNRQTDFAVSVTPHNQNRTVSVFGIGAYSGFTSVTVPIYPRVPADTALPVSLQDENDKAVFLFVPRESGTYYYYATSGDGYAEEYSQYLKRGNYSGGSRYVNIRNSCAVCDTPDGSGTVFDSNNYNVLAGGYFCSSVDLSAGQPYYFICGAESAAEYALVISQECRNLRNALISGELYGTHKDGKACSPPIVVTLNGEMLTEGVDFQRIDINSDLPGNVQVRIVGKGLYTGIAEETYQIIYSGKSSKTQTLDFDTPTTVECTAGRTERLWFTVEGAKNKNDLIRYRVLNERVSGGKMDFSVFRYDPVSGSYAMMDPLPGQKTDYELTNGRYCVVVHRVFANVAAKANFTVLKPYSLNDAEITVHDAVYTGDEVIPEMEIIADGQQLVLDKDFNISFPDGNIMFGELHYTIRSNKRSYGTRSGMFQIKVVLPEDAPFISVGEHEVQVTFEDRLAVYRVCPEEETTYLLASPDVMNTVLRVFTPDAEMLEQVYGAGSKSLSFTVPAGETRYIMVKFNGTERMGTLHFQLETSLRLLSACEIVADPVPWTGERVLPDLHFYDGEYELIEGKDYRIRYSYNDINPGRATINCVGMGTYFGNTDVDYQIILPELFALENFESIPAALDVTYRGTEKTKCPYLIYRYTAGTETMLHVDIVRSAVRLNVQRYDSDGHWVESLFVKPDGFTEFMIGAGETAYFLLSATDISGWNQVYDFELSAMQQDSFRLVEDNENGVTYRVLTDGSYAEVCKIDPKQTKITLQKEIDGVPVRFMTEGTFYLLPESAVVIGYAGCDAAKYADVYRFAYQETAEEDTVPHDLNGDGRFSIADAVLLSRVLAEQPEVMPEAVRFAEADCNADGMADVDDLRIMLTLLTGATEVEHAD